MQQLNLLVPWSGINQRDICLWDFFSPLKHNDGERDFISFKSPVHKKVDFSVSFPALSNLSNNDGLLIVGGVIWHPKASVFNKLEILTNFSS